LLAISGTLLASGSEAVRATAPIRPLIDRLELPGGKVVPIGHIETAGDKVFVRFDSRNQINGIAEYPNGHRQVLTPNQRVKYRIHRSPSMSNTAPLALPRGVAVDLNYSGIGLTGNQFATGPSAVRSIVINF